MSPLLTTSPFSNRIYENRRPIVERTWANVLDHSRDAQSDLTSLLNAGNVFHQQLTHHANAVTTMTDLVAQHLLEMPTEEPPLVVPPPDVANAVFQQRNSSLVACKAALLAQMTAMMSLMRTGLLTGTNPQRNTRNTRTGHNGRTNNWSSSRGCLLMVSWYLCASQQPM